MELKLLLQIVGVALGLLYLWLEYRADIRLWVVGLIMPCVHGTLYFTAGLYADSAMQLYYILAGVYGWLVWRNAPRKSSAEKSLTIAHTPLDWWPRLVAVYAVLHFALYLFLRHLTDSTVPFFDAMTTALSVVALWMLSHKRVEQWLVWALVDALTVGLYLYKGIPLTAALYGLYTVLAFVGWQRWRHEAQKKR